MPASASASRALWGLRAAAWALSLWPAVELAWRMTHALLGPNPVEFLERYTGLWSLRLLLVALALTPLRRLTGRVEFVQIRRLLGRWAVARICGHVVGFLSIDLEWSPAKLVVEVVKRTYITLGFSGWLLLIPLALTSTRGWQRRLGRRWKSLHRLVWPAVWLGGLHFLWLVKSDHREPLLYLAITAALLLARASWPWRRRQPSHATRLEGGGPA